MHIITGAAPAHSQDHAVRMRRYLISMAIRTACFVLAFVVDGPLRWVAIGAAMVLPYVAVVLVNAGNRRPAAVPAPPVTSDDPPDPGGG